MIAKDNLDLTNSDMDLNTICEKKKDYIGAGTLGDIMSDPSEEYIDDNLVDEIRKLEYQVDTENKNVRSEDKENGWSKVNEDMKEQEHDSKELSTPKISGLITSVGGTLQSRFGSKIHNISPLDRIALTANGNLQRIFSSYYDAPVHVYVDRCEARIKDKTDDSNQVNEKDLSSGAVWDRTVYLAVHGQNFCKANSVITVYSAECVRLVESGDIGLGQLFRYLDKLPTFALLDAGMTKDNGLWRRYQLQCNELKCLIYEEFTSNAWTISPKPWNDFGDGDNI
eukprot:CAMPEP_0184871254 /NCGR_PEP_ID=MMETSP0580-20130426/40510_1 /TAXON_ID=1118495 /ORGANISM="Dactyliosolen fragilissimus" /LENGTH=281 /DNA_ID=CAMNT_0027373871 /DNA_START=397 /DNA_END=1239 /DNA_ORIENTATION=-